MRFLNLIKKIYYSGLVRLLFQRPRFFFLLFKIRIVEKYCGIDLFFLSPRFLLIYIFECRKLKKISDFQLTKLGNYFLDISKISKDFPTLYSGGVGTNISFDLEFLKLAGGQARLFDPTLDSANFMKDKVSSNINFYQYAIYKDNKKVKIYFDRYNHIKSNSISNFLSFNKSDFYFCDAYNVPHLIKKFKDPKIDVLKLDIEGVCMEVVENCFDNNIYPNQMILAIEVPMNYFEFYKFYKKLNSFVLNLEKNYNLINLRDRSRGVELEILCIKKEDYNVIC